MVQIAHEPISTASVTARPITAAQLTPWSDNMLLAARQQGDPDVDALVQTVIQGNGHEYPVGRLAYNDLLDIADKLLEAPELALIQSSTVSQQLAAYPQYLVNYFDPMVAPDWVDPKKLARASQLWDDNMLAIIGVLYAASLPACYLIHNGIPALYQSSKLKDHRYIYQRIYETGLFLDDILSPGGLRLLSDIESHGINPDHVCTALNTCDPAGGWMRQGDAIVKSNSTAPAALDPQQVQTMVGHLGTPPQRYLWGKGYIAAKKVRFLHAAMRLMLTHPDGATRSLTGHDNPNTIAESLAHPTSPWQTETWGKPINQADLAYTLLTFAYLIPCGLEKWGCTWTIEEKEAFLHLWKTVGYVIGVDTTFLTDSWQEAERLFVMIRNQQAGPSMAGKTLTGALMRFLQDYLPPVLARHVPPLLIRSQLGAHYAAMLFSSEQLRATQSIVPRLCFGLFLGLLRLYYLARNFVFRHCTICATYMGRVFAQAGEALINSWRDAYVRRPFYVPANAYTWKRVKGVQEDFMVHLQKWRLKLFSTVAAGLGFLIMTPIFVALATFLWLCERHSGAQTTTWLALGCLITGIGIFKLGIPYICRKRPTLRVSDN